MILTLMDEFGTVMDARRLDIPGEAPDRVGDYHAKYGAPKFKYGTNAVHARREDIPKVPSFSIRKVHAALYCLIFAFSVMIVTSGIAWWLGR